MSHTKRHMTYHLNNARLASLLAFCLASVLFFGSGCGESNCSPSGRYLVVTPYAGMSNRLRVLASAKIMAAVTGRQLVVHWAPQENEAPPKWNDLFYNPIPLFEHSLLATQDGCSLSDITRAKEGNPMINNLGSQNDSTKRIHLINLPDVKEPVVYFGTSMNFKPGETYLSTDEYEARYRLFYQNLDPMLRVTNDVTAFRKDHGFDQKYMIGVHYRAWATGKADERDIKALDREHKYLDGFFAEMRKAMALPLAATDNKPVAFFLTTDDASIKAKILAMPEFSNRIFTTSYAIDRGSVEGMQNALIDWFLLGSTEYIIGTNSSSFSDEAARLTKQGLTQRRKIRVGENPFRQ